MVKNFPGNLFGASFASIDENFKVKDQQIINWKDYCEIQVPQLSQSNWSNQFSATNGTYLASLLTD